MYRRPLHLAGIVQIDARHRRMPLRGKLVFDSSEMVVARARLWPEDDGREGDAGSSKEGGRSPDVADIVSDFAILHG